MESLPPDLGFARARTGTSPAAWLFSDRYWSLIPPHPITFGPSVCGAEDGGVMNPRNLENEPNPVKHDQPTAQPNAPSPFQGFSTRSVHSGEQRQKSQGSITTPVYAASTFTFASTDDLLDYVEGRVQRPEYGRYGTPNEQSVEQKIAELENAEEALLYSSGMSAIVGLLLAKLNAGDEVVFFDQCYHRSREFCLKHMSRFGVTTHQVKTGDFAAMKAAINERTKLLVSESPTNPHLTTIDLEQFAALGQAHRIDTLIDATLATPFNQRPLDYGIDYVLHSATKYLAGHNDVIAGVLCGSQEKLEPIRTLRGTLGSIGGAHALYLLERGLKTFALRMQRHNENGLAVARFLESHPRIAKVYYPGLESHPSHAIAKAQMNGYGGLITFLLRDADWRQTGRFVDAVKIPRIAASLGGVESLIEQPLVMSYYHYSPEDRQRFGIDDNMVRMSCGIEDSADLIHDLAQALEVIDG